MDRSLAGGSANEITAIAATPTNQKIFLPALFNTSWIRFAAAGSSGSESVPSVLPITVVLSVAASDPVTVQFSVTGGTATPGSDYLLAPGNLTFAPGETRKTIAFQVINDTVDEYDETVIIRLVGTAPDGTVETHTHTYTIVDDDAASVIQFGSNVGSGLESIGTLNIPVTLSPASEKTVAVQVAVSPAPPTGGSVDYSVPAGLTFAPGETQKNLVLTLIDDSLVEPAEILELSLVNPVDAIVGTAHTYQYTILDNDLPTVSFALASSSGTESSTSVYLTVNLSAAAYTTVIVNFSTSGTASLTGDYSIGSSPITLPASETSKTIPISVVNDSIQEPDETIVVALTGADGASPGSPATHTYTILNDDFPELNFLGVPTLLSSTIGIGGKVSLTSASIRNNGNDSSGAFQVGYYQSSDATITAADTLMGSYGCAALAPSGQCGTGAQLLTLPSNTGAGTYYVGLLIDSGNSVPESNESNNTWSSAITIVAPDLVFQTGPTVTPNPVAIGGSITFTSFNVLNQGTAAAAAFTVGYYLSTNNQWDASDTRIGFQSIASLAASATLSIPTFGTKAGVAGTFYVILFVDDGSSILESNENNNYHVLPGTLTVK